MGRQDESSIGFQHLKKSQGQSSSYWKGPCPPCPLSGPPTSSSHSKFSYGTEGQETGSNKTYDVVTRLLRFSYVTLLNLRSLLLRFGDSIYRLFSPPFPAFSPSFPLSLSPSISPSITPSFILTLLFPLSLSFLPSLPPSNSPLSSFYNPLSPSLSFPPSLLILLFPLSPLYLSVPPSLLPV